MLNNIRYTLKFGKGSLSFSAPPVKTDKELGNILMEVAQGLLSKHKKVVVAECKKCMEFIYENETHTCKK